MYSVLWRSRPIAISGFFLFPGRLGHIASPVRRAVHVAVPRHFAAGRRRGHPILSNTTMAQARQHQGASFVITLLVRLDHCSSPIASYVIGKTDQVIYKRDGFCPVLVF